MKDELREQSAMERTNARLAQQRKWARWQIPYVVALVLATGIVVGVNPGWASAFIAMAALGLGGWVLTLTPERLMAKASKRKKN